ncbi:hypothetical protein [Nocardia sp. XZ_19_369]|uniref:hypothetical protein n=1 Tax=Nocardia sp. XZ_19_369 TaxID=2769487 RepID=UPI00188EAD2C|nr:hypothetical protein [Nocardia sp. XZ_19_369]
MTPSASAIPGQQLNESLAQTAIQRYLTETLNALPPGVSLSAPLTEANGQKVEFDLANLPAVPCDGNPDSTTGPKKAQVFYFITGIPKGKAAEYFNSVVRIWSDRLWQVWPIKPDEQSNAVTNDGYLLAVARAQAGNGSGQDGLSLAGTSPCFPNTATGTATPLPTVIEHR